MKPLTWICPLLVLAAPSFAQDDPAWNKGPDGRTERGAKNPTFAQEGPARDIPWANKFFTANADNPPPVILQDFRDLPNCIAVLRLSHSIPIEFSCLKWNVTGVKPKSVADSCAGPAGGKAMPLDRL